MRAVRIHETNGIEGIRLEDIERPQPGPGQVRVALRAAALNHLDLWVSQGMPKPPLPHTLGSDGAGVIDAVGEGAPGVAVGDRVCLDPSLSCGSCERCAAGEHSECARFGILGESRSGTFGEAVVCPAHCCHPIPEGFTFEEAAAMGLTHLTAFRMLFTRARLLPGEDLLIHGIGGGVATSALLLAKAAGARVSVTSSSNEKLDRARELGAHLTVNYREAASVAKAVKKGLGRGVDVVLETTGASTWADSLSVCRKGGRIVVCGATTGGNPKAGLQTIFWKQLSILGSTMGSRGDFRRMLAFAGARSLKPVIDSVFKLEDAKEALARLERGEQLGKVVLSIKAHEEES
ncbi:MAG: zinc-binding dehydrogenase [Planctomycetota bacterium]|jgi:NADPH:quinone reductase-like Zn-dependent oxidoreductase